jgi:glycosyltransferase involved in cell wall biosynthesis
MECLSYHLVETVRAIPGVQVEAFVWRHRQLFLPVFMIVALARSIQVCTRGVDVIHIGDPVLSPLGVILKKMFHVPVAITVHGLDLTFSAPFYQMLVPRWVHQLDKVICISRAAYQIGLERGINPSRSVIIHPGVDVPRLPGTKRDSRARLSKRLTRDLQGSKVLLTVGRLVPRKGVYFFVRNVLPKLVRHDASYRYVVVGQGSELNRIRTAVVEQQMEEYVCLAGYLEPEDLLHAYNASDLFIVPNVPQQNNAEGFGLVVLEAAAAGCPVLLSDLEGLRDTVPGEQGSWFVSAGDADGWVNQIKKLFETPERLRKAGVDARVYVTNHCTWSGMAHQYIEQFRKMISDD